MKRFWSRICGFVSEHDLFFRLFLILFGCIILPVSIACIAFNWQAENLVRTQTERTNSAYLTSLSTQLESALNAQRMQMLDYSVKETLTGSFRSNKFTKDATTLLTNALSSNENLEAVFVLDPGTNRIASNIGCFDAEIYFSKYCRFPGYSFEELYGTLCENRAFSFIGALDYTRYSLVKIGRTAARSCCCTPTFPSNHTARTASWALFCRRHWQKHCWTTAFWNARATSAFLMPQAHQFARLLRRLTACPCLTTARFTTAVSETPIISCSPSPVPTVCGI